MLLLPTLAELRKAQVSEVITLQVSVRKPRKCLCSSMAGKTHPESTIPPWNVVGLHSRVSLDEERSPSRVGVGPGQVFASLVGLVQSSKPQFRMPFGVLQIVGSC